MAFRPPGHVAGSNAAADLSFFGVRTAGLTQRERRAEGDLFRNTFDVLADVCPGRCLPTPLTRQGGAETHVVQTSVLKPAHPAVHGSYLAAAGGAILAKHIIRSTPSTPSTPISDNILHTRTSGVDSAAQESHRPRPRWTPPLATDMYVRTLNNSSHEKIEGGLGSDPCRLRRRWNVVVGSNQHKRPKPHDTTPELCNL